jgi:CO/xanthine dehydrogenase Mo-binding subunit
MSELKVVGKSLPRVDGIAKVTGRAQYAADLSLPGMLYGKILFSDRPHARIRAIDLTRALAHPGVGAIVTAANAPSRRYGIYLQDQLIFAQDRVRYVGEPVAAVAAETERAAIEALDLIVVDYENLPAVFDPAEAMRPDAPVIHPELEAYFAVYSGPRSRNVCHVARVTQGDPEVAFGECDYLFENVYQTQVMHQAYLEPHACVAGFDVSGRLAVWTSTQNLSLTHSELAAALDMSMLDLRVYAAWLGGGFGGKLKTQLEPIAALLARSAGRPVKIVLTREEEFQSARARTPLRIWLKTGVKKDGTLLARAVRVVANAGGYADHAPGVVNLAITHVQGTYKIPNVSAEATVVYTNQGNWGCMRGYGLSEMTVATEAQMDLIARHLGMDPADLRLMNLCAEGDPMISGQKFTSVNIRATMEAAIAASDYRTKKANRQPGHGVGIANSIHPSGLLSSSAVVRVNEDATVTILVAVTDIGTGTHTGLCQIVAEVLGVPFEKVRVSGADSDCTPYDQGSVASRTVFDAGGAVHRAAVQVRGQLQQLAASVFHCAPDDVCMQEGRWARKAQPDEALGLQDLVNISIYVQHGPLLGSASLIDIPAPEAPVGEGYFQARAMSFSYTTTVAEVEVDSGTGQTRVVSATAAVDVGKAINPRAVEGQVEGGVSQAVGYALMEEMIIQDGQVQNPSFLDYHIPTFVDMPEVQTVLVEIPDPNGPFGAKGVGEPPFTTAGPAIVNAIADATGVVVDEIPLAPERLYGALCRS